MTMEISTKQEHEEKLKQLKTLLCERPDSTEIEPLVDSIETYENIHYPLNRSKEHTMMDFSKIDFCHKAFVDLHVGAYGSLSGMFYTGKSNLITLEQFFKDSHDWQPSFEHEGRQYMMGFVDPGNVRFQQFMRDEAEIERKHAEEFYKQHGFYEQTHDFVEIWNDNNVSDVQISFPRLTAT